jgi:hypothetical protein
MCRPKAGLGIGQYCKADNRLRIQIADAVIINEHALGEVFLWLALDLDVNQYPLFSAVKKSHTNQFVGITPSIFGLHGDFLQLFIQEFYRLLPVN